MICSPFTFCELLLHVLFYNPLCHSDLNSQWFPQLIYNVISITNSFRNLSIDRMSEQLVNLTCLCEYLVERLILIFLLLLSNLVWYALPILYSVLSTSLWLSDKKDYSFQASLSCHLYKYEFFLISWDKIGIICTLILYLQIMLILSEDYGNNINF